MPSWSLIHLEQQMTDTKTQNPTELQAMDRASLSILLESIRQNNANAATQITPLLNAHALPWDDVGTPIQLNQNNLICTKTTDYANSNFLHIIPVAGLLALVLVCARAKSIAGMGQQLSNGIKSGLTFLTCRKSESTQNHEAHTERDNIFRLS